MLVAGFFSPSTSSYIVGEKRVCVLDHFVVCPMYIVPFEIIYYNEICIFAICHINPIKICIIVFCPKICCMRVCFVLFERPNFTLKTKEVLHLQFTMLMKMIMGIKFHKIIIYIISCAACTLHTVHHAHYTDGQQGTWYANWIISAVCTLSLLHRGTCGTHTHTHTHRTYLAIT